MSTESNTSDNIVTVKQYLQGCAGQYPLDENTLLYLSVKCAVVLDKDVTTLTAFEQDKLEMTMLRYLLSQPGMTGSITDTNGSWSHKEGAVEMNSADKKHLKDRLHDLEKKYGISSSSVKVHNIGSNIYNGKV